MNAQCPICKARYRVKEAAIPDSGLKVVCPKCKAPFFIKPEYQTLKEEPPPQSEQIFEREIGGGDQQERVRQIGRKGWGYYLSWILGVLLSLASISVFFQTNFVSGLFYLAAGIVLIPPLAEKLGISLPGKFKALIVLGCLLGAGIAMTSAPKKIVSPPATKKAASEVSPKPEAPRTDIAKPIETEKPLPPIAGNAAISEASKTPSKQTVLSEIRRLYLDLQNFKNDLQFHRFGFAPGHKYRNWQLETKRLVDSTPRDVGMEVMKEGVVPGDLLMLGSEYLTSKGKETEYTRYINAQFQQALKMK